jgi:hypothetical protein
MAEDARKTTHPVQTPVEADSRAMDIFDAITYTKGEAFIRMLEAYVGEDKFREGCAATCARTGSRTPRRRPVAPPVGGIRPGRPVVCDAMDRAAWLPARRIAQRCEGGHAVVTLAQERFTLNDPQAKPLGVESAADAFRRWRAARDPSGRSTPGGAFCALRTGSRGEDGLLPRAIRRCRRSRGCRGSASSIRLSACACSPTPLR